MNAAPRMRTLVFETFGGPEVLRVCERPLPTPGADCLLVETTAVGLNFAHIYRRQGRYPLEDQAPHIAGYEGVGRVVALGGSTRGWRIGDRIGFADVPFAHATHVSVPIQRAMALPDDIDDLTAAAMLLQGLTAQFLTDDSVAVRRDQTVLVHAASGGVGG